MNDFIKSKTFRHSVFSVFIFCFFSGMVLVGGFGFLSAKGWIAPNLFRNLFTNDRFIKEIQEISSDQLVREILYVTGIGDQVQYQMFSDLITQGASYEGIYRGIIYSENYRMIEASTPLCKNENEIFQKFISEFMRLSTTFPDTYRWSREAVVSSGSMLERWQRDEKVENLPSPETPKGKVSAIAEFYGFYPFQRKAKEAYFTQMATKLFEGAGSAKLVRFLGEHWLTATAKDGWPDEIANEIVYWNLSLQPLLNNSIPLKSFRYSTSILPWKGWVMEVGRDRAQWEVLYRIHLWFRLSCKS